MASNLNKPDMWKFSTTSNQILLSTKTYFAKQESKRTNTNAKE